MSNLKIFESNHIRSYWNDAEQVWYISVIDVIKILTESTVPKGIGQILKRN